MPSSRPLVARLSNPAEVAHGPMFIGFTFNVFLFGIMITQVYLYFTTYKDDKKWMKIFVIILFIADTANTIFDFAYIYRSLIVHFDDIGALATADWLFATDPAITGIIASSVQLFFAWRVRILTHNWPLAVVVLLGSLSGVAGAIATSFEVGKTPQFTDFRNFKGVVIVWLVSESITDITITTSLVWYFNDIKPALKSRIIWSTASYATGLITSVVATLDLILYLIYPNGIHLIFNFPLCKLYTNSLMSSLNARAGWRYGSTTRDSTTTSNLFHDSDGSGIPTSDRLSMGGGMAVPGTILEQREHGRRFSARSLGFGRHDAAAGLGKEGSGGSGPLPVPSSSPSTKQRVRAATLSRRLSARCMASLARPVNALHTHKPRPEVYVHVDVDVESSRQLERVDVGRGAEMVTVPIMASRSESGAILRGNDGTSMMQQMGSGFRTERPPSACLSVGTDISNLKKVEESGEDSTSDRKPEASAEDLMRELDLDLGLGLGSGMGRAADVMLPSKLEAGRGPFS